MRSHCLAVSCLCLSPAFAQSLVTDVNAQPPLTDPFGSSPSQFLGTASQAWFSASDSSRGIQLWTSDGTTAGTRVPRLMPVDDLFQPSNLVEWNGVVYFLAYSVSQQYGLWRSDGTTAGTYPLHLWSPPFSGSAVRYLCATAGGLLFAANDGIVGEELWRSDGTIAGTTLLRDIDGTPGDSMPGPFALANGVALFAASVGVERELWRTDGTAAGTFRLFDIEPGPGGSFPQQLTTTTNGVLFTAFTTTAGVEPWWSDGTAAGTRQLADVTPGAASTSLTKLTSGGNLGYFVAPGPLGTELWRTDGTVAGTGLVADVNPGAASSAPDQLRSVGPWLFFSADDGVHGREPWRTDGTAAGTVLVADLVAGSAGSTPRNFQAAGANVLFDAAPTSSGRTLYRASAAGVTAVRAFTQCSVLGTLGASAVLNANDGQTGDEPWISDGTAAGTALLRDIQYLARTSTVRWMRATGDDLLLSADDGVHGIEPWRVPTGGTASLLLDIDGGSSSGNPTAPVAFQGLQWFAANDTTHGNELWRTDGTGPGTQLFADLLPGSQSSNPTQLTAVGASLFFTSDATLWASDGTVSGTQTLRTFFQRQPFPSLPASFTSFLGALYFAADDATLGVELWRSDGTPAGTVPLLDIQVGPGSAFPDRLVVAGNRLFFRAQENTHGNELWVSDGTAAGTAVLDLTPGPSSSLPDRLVPFGSRVFFTRLVGAANRLAISDGTLAGTVLLSLTAGEPRSLVLAGDRLFFSAIDGSGRELWVSDGTPAGTHRVADVRPGSADALTVTSEIGALGSAARVVFAADDGVHGSELWTSDGTANGTTLVADVAPDLLSSSPSMFVRAGTDLYFLANDYVHGNEPWRLPLAQLGAPLVDVIEPGCAPSNGPAPTLEAVGLPVLGNPAFGLQLRGAPANTLVLSGFDTVHSPIAFVGCTFVFFGPPILLTGATDALGQHVTTFAIPAAPSLIGYVLLAQDAVLDPLGPQGVFTASPGLRLLVGR